MPDNPAASASKLAAREPSLPTTPARPWSLDAWLLARIGAALGAAPLRFVLWNGIERTLDSASPVASALIADRRTLLALALDPEREFGDAYSEGRVEVTGDLVAFLEALYRALEASRARGTGRKRAWLARRANDLQRARANVQRHYDIGNDFYRLWLDERMVYTCAYFPSPEASLEEAQLAKMDLICRKLRLRPGERVVEAGCGWGALALYMARRYGVSVRAFNVSHEQIAYARQRAHEEGLGERVEFLERDYRDIDGQADVFVSVGMLEHVGLDNYGSLGAVVHRCLGAGRGRGLLHFIGRHRPRQLNAWITERIFPGAYAPALSEVFEGVLEPWGFSVLDVENLRLHYARTLEHWRARFEAVAVRVAALFDERFVRAWRLYLAGSQAAFSMGSLQLFQVLFGRPGDNNVPWTRQEYTGPREVPRGIL